MVNVKIKRLEREGRLPSLPRYATEGAAACDLEAFISGYLELDPGVRMAIPTGLSIELPEGYEDLLGGLDLGSLLGGLQ